jgi:LuxR family maltose regulon positive regulatory protein
MLEEAATHVGAPDDGAREALVHAFLGETALWAHDLPRAGEELGKAVAGARAHQLDYVALSALSYLALHDVMTYGPADDHGHGQAAIELAARRGWSKVPQTACAHTALALLAFYDLQPHAAAEHLAQARVAAGQLRRRHLDFVIAHLDARMSGALGRPREGLRTLEDYEAVHRHRGPRLDHELASVATMRARLHIQAGELEAAAATLAPVGDEPWMAVGTTAARLALATGETADAVELLERCRHQPAVHAVTPVETIGLLAIAHAENGEPHKAARALEEALALAEGNRHRWPFIELGRPMEALLRDQIRSGTAHRAIVGELLDAFADRAPATRHVAPLLEPLSEREQAILRYLPTALSNREIAAELFVTTNTVKTHLRSIYRKLDVARRREAVERARDLRLLSSRR